LRARHQDEGRSWLLELSGEADVATLRMLRQELGRVLAADREERVVDLTHLAFCDVASAHLLLTARRTAGVTLTGATGTVRRVFDLLEALRVQRMPHYLEVNRSR
jgi:anti-anti-sigma factor